MEIKPFARYYPKGSSAGDFCFDVYNILGKYFISLNEKNSRFRVHNILTKNRVIGDIEDYLKKKGNPFTDLEEAEGCLKCGFSNPLGNLENLIGENLERELAEETERGEEKFIVIDP